MFTERDSVIIRAVLSPGFRRPTSEVGTAFMLWRPMFAGRLSIFSRCSRAHSAGRRSRAERGLHLMTSRKRKSHSASRPVTGALARWETEGGALGSAGRGRDGRVPSPSKRRISCSALGRRCSCNGTICRPMFRGSSSSIPSPASNHVRSRC
jgi:hypothetical protein